MPNTIYQPIYTHKYQTRILTILPSSDSSSQVECILRPVSLLDNISYQALSYTWGINDTIALLVNGINFPVRTNLASALKHIRESNKEVTLWADAVCIDQGNRRECNHQVRLMARIYAKARQVIVWLGEEDEDSDYGMDIFRQWALSLRRVHEANLSTSPTVWSQEIPEVVFQPRATEAAIKIIKRPVWSRIWVLQEICIPHAVLVKCGHKQLDIWHFDIVERASLQFQESMREHLNELPPNRTTWTTQFHSQMNRSWQVMLATRRLIHKPENHTSSSLFTKIPALSFLVILAQTAGLKATDPHDRIFALAGLANLLEPERRIDIDYSTSICDLYSDFSTKFMHKNFILNSIESGSSGGLIIGTADSYLPSWVPNYSKTTCTAVLDSSAPIYHATRSSQAELRFSLDSKAMYAQGTFCDTVTSVKGFEPPTDEFPYPWKHLLAFDRLGRAYPTGIPWLEALLRTLLHDYDGSARAQLSRNSTWFKRHALIFCSLFASSVCSNYEQLTQKAMLEAVPSFSNSDNGPFAQAVIQTEGLLMHDYCVLSILHELFRNAAEDGNENVLSQLLDDVELLNLGTENDEAKDRLSCAMEGRHFIMTEKGYMGIVPPQTRNGDKICVLLGATVPFVIRPVDNHYIVVGPCFILGYMYGEALDIPKPVEAKLQEFKIH